MELLGNLQGRDVAAVSASSANDTGFASLSSDGTVCLWDVRLKKRNYMAVACPQRCTDATEILFAADKNIVVTLCDRHVRFADVRRDMAFVAEYTHSCEAVMFVDGKHPLGQQTTIVVDETGAVFPLDLSVLRPTTEVESWVFGAPYTCSAGFGSLGNYCCGLGLLDVRDADKEEEEGVWSRRTLVALGMDGHGLLHGSPEYSVPFAVSLDDTSERSDNAKMFNPPLPTCCSFHGDRAVVGRADGTYALLQLEGLGTSLAELMAAPGHACNGLCYVRLAEEGQHVLTASLCGQITLWHTEQFMNAPEDAEDELPPVLAALDHRACVGSTSAVVNAGTELCRGSYLFADTEGNVTLARTSS